MNKQTFKHWIALVFAILALFAFLSVSSSPAATAPVNQLDGKKVTIDPGHGWSDSRTGATANGMVEKDINLDIANLLKPLLEAQGIEVSMTRTGDEFDKPLATAAQRANQYQADIVVSIHTNAGAGGNPGGTESCHTVSLDTSIESLRLASLLTQHVSDVLELRLRGNWPENSESYCSRGRWTPPYLYIHYMDPPTALIETAFIDGEPSEVVKLQDRRADFAQAIAQAVFEYFGMEDAGANVDVDLIIDSSGSMSWNDPGNRRLNAANAYVLASAEGDYVGVVDFDSSARTASPLLRLPDNRQQLSSAISTIDSSGGTNIGAGVQLGCNELVSSPSSNARKGAILLTDGVGSYSDQAGCFAANGWPIYAFGFGDANDALLDQIADGTGGEYTRLTTSNLVCEFQRVRAKIAGVEPDPCQSTFINPLQLLQFLLQIPLRIAQATFTTSWGGSDVEMSLISPSGRIIDRSTSAPDVIHEVGATYEVYTIIDPERGEWLVQLYGADVPPSGEEVTFGSTFLPAEVTGVAIDIKPDGVPNSVNCNNANAIIPVAILSTSNFDATTVDHTTVFFEGAGERHTDRFGIPKRHEEDVDHDGDIDLVFHFTLNDTSLNCDSEVGILDGETYDGTAIEGIDSIRMVNK